MNERNSNKTIQIGYSANDFFYNTLPLFSFDLSETNCFDVSSHTIWNIDMSMNCYNHEMCNNKQYAKQIFNINNTHGKSNIQLNDTNKEYYYQYIQTINLGIGNLFLLFVIFYKIYNS